MSSEQYQRTVNSLDKEIAHLEKKKAAKDREVANLQGRLIFTNLIKQKKVRIVLISERRLPKNERSVLKLI